MTESFKKRFSFYAKIAISALILYFVFRRIDLQSVAQNIVRIPVWAILVLLVTAAGKIYFQLLNWEKYLKLNPDYKPKRNEIAKSFFIGEALRFVVPGGYGTIGKMYFVNNKKGATFVSVGIEKFLLIWAALFFASIAGLFYFAISVEIKILIFILILSLPLLVPLLGKFFKHESAPAFTQGYSKILLPVIGRHAFTMVLTIIQYFIVINSFYSISIPHAAISVPLILAASIIPITISGLGLRETFAVEVLDKFGIIPEVAVACSLTVFAVNNIIPALIGAYLMVRHKK